jgi:hypothetical protein
MLWNYARAALMRGGERHWRERYPSGDTTYQSVQYRTLSKAAEKVYDDGLQSDLLIYGVLRYFPFLSRSSDLRGFRLASN